MNTAPTPSLSKQEAIKAMQEGKKVTHRYFTPEEYVYMKDGEMFFEDGVSCSSMEFWSLKTDTAWETDWVIFNS